MEQIFLRSAELPGRVKGVTVKVEDDYIVFVNSNLCSKTQRQTIEHEVRHIKRDHFYNTAPVIINEIQAM